MYQLIYASTATAEMDKRDLAALLEKARVKNERLGVTGLLLYQDGAFIQVLEGEKETLRALYQTIVADERHTDVVLLREGAVERREFGAWSMGFKTVDAAEMQDVPGFSSFLEEDTVHQLRKLAARPSFAYEALVRFKTSAES